MRIKSIRIENYKGFRDSGTVHMGEQFTVLVGQNNSGKTAFLEALRPGGIVSNPHREYVEATESLPPILNPASSVTFDVCILGSELRWFLLSTRAGLHLPLVGNDPDAARAEVERFFSSELRIELAFASEQGWRVGPSNWLARQNPQYHAEVIVSQDKQEWTIRSVGRGQNTLASLAIGYLTSRSIYLFRAERMNLGKTSIEPTSELRPDASNLPSVLLQLQADPATKEQFTRHLRTVLPALFDVISRPIQQSQAELRVILRDHRYAESRPGLSLPLDDCGTGISQIVALLYIVVAAPSARVIVIDEPNSFLHPGAVKKLFHILRQSGHQYVVTTHSTEIVRAAQPDVIHLTRWDGQESSVQSLDARKIADLRRLLDEIGVSLSDLFGADAIIWVEGATEELCFPLLLEHAGRQLSAGIAIVAIINTGDLESGRPRNTLAWEVYEKLSGGPVVVPPALAFSFDREGRTQQEVDDMERRSRALVRFLPRRSYENYLIDCDAISVALQESGVEVTSADVHSWIAAHGMDRAYFDDQSSGTLGDPKWVASVNAPKLLSALFRSLSGSALEYRKTTHSVAITRWLLANKSEQLTELTSHVTSLAPQ